jgi:hypothetical protein
MKSWLRRFGYLLFLIVWLMVVCFPTFAFVLAMSGQIEMGSNPRNHLRFFMVQEEDTAGIGMEWARPLLNRSTCAKTSVVYLLWEGGETNQNSSFCHCYDPETAVPLPVDENSCG